MKNHTLSTFLMCRSVFWLLNKIKTPCISLDIGTIKSLHKLIQKPKNPKRINSHLITFIYQEIGNLVGFSFF